MCNNRMTHAGKSPRAVDKVWVRPKWHQSKWWKKYMSIFSETWKACTMRTANSVYKQFWNRFEADLIRTLSSCRLFLMHWKAEAVVQSRCPNVTMTDIHINTNIHIYREPKHDMISCLAVQLGHYTQFQLYLYIHNITQKWGYLHCNVCSS